MKKFEITGRTQIINLIFRLTIKIVYIFSMILLMHGCQKDNCDRDLPYLELSFSIDDAPVFMIDSHDIEMIDEARARMENYVELVNDRFILSIYSGEKINISCDLFNALKAELEQANNRIAAKELIIDDYGLKINQDKIIVYALKRELPGEPREQDRRHIEVEWTAGFGWGSGYRVTLSHEATLFALAGGTSLSFFSPDPTVAKLLGLLGLWGTTHYAAFGGGRGIIIIENGPFLPPTIIYIYSLK
jgi:hypothetical protein